MSKRDVSSSEKAILNDRARLKDAPRPGGKNEDEFNKGVPGKGSRGRHAANPMTVFRGTIKLVFSFYPLQFTLMLVCVVVSAVLSTFPSIYLQRTIDVISRYWQSGDWAAASPEITQIAIMLVCTYAVALAGQIAQTQLGAFVTQGTLMQIRNKMFDHMEDLPISFFDRNQRGDIMSYYTNDVDALRQLIGVALPNLLTMAISMISLTFIMLWYSIPLSLVVLVMVAFMGWFTRFMGGRSARFFLAQQHAIGRAEGFAEEAMNGEKVIKVFTHEKEMQEQFDQVNDELFEAAKKANIYSNVLGPILMNLGNLSYVVVALAGGLFLGLAIPNPSISGMVLSIDIVIPFLNLTKRFAGSIGQISPTRSTSWSWASLVPSASSSCSTSSPRKTTATSRSCVQGAWRARMIMRSATATPTAASGHGSIRTRARVPSRTYRSRARSSSTAWISATPHKSSCCMT